MHVQPSAEEIQYAAGLLRAGNLVAFPTETVYGLGANALNAETVARIFEAKGRPNTSPIIVHVSDFEMAEQVAAAWPDSAKKLAEQFWPGPLTLVLPKTTVVPDIVTAGLPTVGVRMPAHPVALALIRATQLPIAAPSANRFTQVSPTTADHVRRSLGNRVAYVLDGGPCQVGIESTVLSLAGEVPLLLRPGGVSREEIEKLIGFVASSEETTESAHPSPGMHPRHYSPRTPVVLVTEGRVPHSGSGAYLQVGLAPDIPVRTIVPMPNSAAEYAVKLYSVLHELDQYGHDWIAVELPGSGIEWEAVLDRLRRAAFEGKPSNLENKPPA
jgi:L-threonylcarbamoyladenylate synthase